MRRVFESILAGLVVALVTLVIAWRLEADVVLLPAAGFLVAFAAWASTPRYVHRRTRHR